MNIDSAITTGNLLKYVVQPALVTASSVYFHDKGCLPRSSAAAMVIVHTAASYFFASKTENDEAWNQIPISLGSTILISLATVASPKFRIEGKYNDEIGCLVLLGVLYTSISIMVHAAARRIILGSIESSLGDDLQITESMQREIRAAWKKINETIDHASYSFLPHYLPFHQRLEKKKYVDLTVQEKFHVKDTLAKEQITLFNGKVFALKNYPHLIFKQITRTDFDLLISHLRVCKEFQLTELVIPSSKFVVIDGRTFVVQKKLDYNTTKQPHYYVKHAERLKKAILQLHTYILQTGEADVECRNMPIIGNVKDKSGRLRIALIDHEILHGENNPEWGIVGYERLHRTGLIGLLCEEQAQEVARLSRQVLTKFSEEINKALTKRVAELAIYKQTLESNRPFKEWASKHGRKSNKTIPRFTNLPHLTAYHISFIDTIWMRFNQAIAQRNPQDFLSRYGLRTITLVATPDPKDAYQYRRLLDETLSILKNSGNIFEYETKSITGANFQNQIHIIITA